jgi:hypothetical protein
MLYFNLIIIILLLFIIYIITQTIKLRLLFNLNNDNIYCNIFFLYPLLKIIINIEDTTPFIIVYIFKIKVYKKPLKIKKNTNTRINLYKAVNPNNIEMTTHYGFKDPFHTGIVCGAFSIIAGYINLAKIKQFPNFMASNDYIYVDAKANINIGNSIIYLVKNKFKKY